MTPSCKLAFTLFATLLVACATPSSPTKATLEARTFESASIDPVMRAFKDVMIAEGSVIKRDDLMAGELSGIVVNPNRKGVFWAIVGDKTSAGRYEWKVLFKKTEPVVVSSLLTVRTMGANPEDVSDERLFAGLYAKVRLEIDRRKSPGKK